MVSAVYSTADVGDSENPSKHPIGRVCDDIEPTDINGLSSTIVERSLKLGKGYFRLASGIGRHTKIELSCLSLPISIVGEKG